MHSKSTAFSISVHSRPMAYEHLRGLMSKAGVSQADLAKVLNKTPAVVTNLFNGVRELKAQEVIRISAWLGKSVGEIMGQNKLSLTGYVDDAGEVRLYSDRNDGLQGESVDCPPGLNPASTVAIRIKGDSMYPVFHKGWTVFYTSERDIQIPIIRDGFQVPYNPPSDEPMSEFIGKPCIVKLKDGRSMLRTLKNGTQLGRYTLASYNAPDLEDVEIEWAAKIVYIKTG
jgi:plasmid maintenance system antidote protein VapI